MKTKFLPRSVVEFDDAHEGTLRGTVMGTLPMLSDQPHAAVILLGQSSLPGVIWTVPLIELRLLAGPPARPLHLSPNDPDAPGNVIPLFHHD